MKSGCPLICVLALKFDSAVGDLQAILFSFGSLCSPALREDLAGLIWNVVLLH